MKRDRPLLGTFELLLVGLVVGVLMFLAHRFLVHDAPVESDDSHLTAEARRD